MTLSEAPYDAEYFDKRGTPTRYWHSLLRTFNGMLQRVGGVTGAALPLPTYTVATLPDAAIYQACLIFVADGTSNKRLAVSDGAAWRFPDGAIVS